MLAFYNMNFRFARKKGGSGLAITEGGGSGLAITHLFESNHADCFGTFRFKLKA